MVIGAGPFFGLVCRNSHMFKMEHIIWTVLPNFDAGWYNSERLLMKGRFPPIFEDK